MMGEKFVIHPSYLHRISPEEPDPDPGGDPFNRAYASEGQTRAVSDHITLRYVQTGLFSVMIVIVIGLVALLFPWILPVPKIEVPSPITLSIQTRPSQLERIRATLGEDIAAGAIAVEPFGSWVAVRVSNVVAFASGEARVLPTSLGLFRRIADVVEAEKGPVRIVGYTDDQPVKANASYRDNRGLSVARAESVATVIRPALSDGGRIAVMGRGAEEPVAENATVEGRAHNRRVEILITRQP